MTTKSKFAGLLEHRTKTTNSENNIENIEIEEIEEIEIPETRSARKIKKISVSSVGIKVPPALAQHWVIEAKRQKKSMTSVIIRALIKQYGTPEDTETQAFIKAYTNK